MDFKITAMDTEMKEFIKGEIEGLARIIAKSFDHVEARFEKNDRRFDAMDRRFDAMDQCFDATDQKIESIYRELKADIADVKMTVGRIDLQTRNHGDVVYEEMSDVRKETKKEIEIVKEDILAVKAFVGMKA